MTTFALHDVNNFYTSVESVFNPKLNYRILICLSNNDGCCISRNPLAKAAGIKMGEPWFEIKKRFKPGEIVALSSNFAAYADMSNRVVDIVARFTQDYEVYSCDEQFLLWTGFEHKDLTQYGHELKATVLKWLGLPVCVGVASTKTLAKTANAVAKKQPEFNGVCNFKTLPEDRLEQLFKALPVGEIWGIGAKLSARLNQIGIHTVHDLKNAHRRTLRDQFSVVMAKIISELNGESCIELEDIPQTKKNIAYTRSFGKPVIDLACLKESVTFYTSRAAEKVRMQHTYANSISVFIHTSPFCRLPYYANCQTVALPSPTHDTRLLVKTALWILKRLYRPGYSYQRAGVLLNDLVPSAGIQRDLFFGVDDDKSARVMAVMDTINRRYGRQTMQIGSEGFNAPWQMKQEFKSPDYTSDWDGLIEAR